MRASLILLTLVITSFMGRDFAQAQDLNYKFSSDMSLKDQQTLLAVMNEVSALLPEKLKKQLPENLEIKVAMLTRHKSIPNEICTPPSKEKKKEKKFIYGQYEEITNTLTLHSAVINELALGRANSRIINCQHKSLYDQALATIIHEITHAYDFHNQRISNTMEFISRAGFKKGLLKS